jgi:predicted metalloprotease with PDZ domain
LTKRATIRIGTLKTVPVCLLLLGLLWPLRAGAEEGEKPESPLRLEYTVSIHPEDRKLGVTATLRGYRGKPIRQFQSRGLREKINIGLSKASDGSMVFRYDLPVRQSTFKDTFKPVLSRDFFTGFCNHLFVLPRTEGRDFDSLALRVAAPEGWKVATSRGIGAAWELAGVPDLMGTLVCAGDYYTDSFELKHAGGDGTTKVHVAIRGDRDWDDGAFVEQFRRLVRGQMEFFGGKHPAPIQFLALHILPEGDRSRVPAFNRRAPGHDTVLALHTAKRSREHFEFLGMLAHEHLHNWYPNVMKSDLGPWFMEGLNDYVAYRGLLANGLHSREQFTGMLSKWHREYHYCLARKDERLMPYRRGMIAAWVFDIELRRATEGRRGLSDVLRNLLDSKPEGGVVQRSHFVAMLKEVSGRDMEPLYQHLVEEGGAVDLPKFLEGTGFRIVPGTRNIAIVLETDQEKKLFESILSRQ